MAQAPLYQVNKYYKVLADDRLQCNICPHNCVLHPGKTGICKARKNIDGKMYSLAYGRPCSVNIDPVEKKPLYHFHPGERILSLGTFGCNLFCKGCQNYDISRSDESTKTQIKDPKDIIRMAKENNIGLIAYTYNEPTIFFEYMLETARLANAQGIKNVIVSNGFINEEPLKELLKYIDAANIDLKGFSEKFYKEYAKASLKQILNTIRIINEHNRKSKHKVWLELTNLIIPGLNDDLAEIAKMCRWISGLDKDIPLHFSRFFPYYEADQIEMTPETTLLKAKNAAKRSGLNYVYIGNLGINDNTYCKKCDALLISREGYSVEMPGLSGPNNDTCKKCRAVLDGVFQ